MNRSSYRQYGLMAFIGILSIGFTLATAGFSSGCGSVGTTNAVDDGADDGGDGGEWTEVDLSFSGSNKPLTSTCTIILLDNTTYRMYFTGPGALYSTTSTDGLAWTSPEETGIAETGATNPSVIRLTNGTYLMIYGVQTAMPMTEEQFRATSVDGIIFTKQGDDPALSADAGENDFVSVADMIYINDTTLRMYFVADAVDSYVHTATSTDDGATWTREGEVSLTGEIGGQLNDPDIVRLSDGSWRLFFTTPPEGQAIGDLRIRSATSTDGRSFTLESGDIATPSDTVDALMDPDAVLQLGTTDAYRVYYGGNLSGGGPDDLRARVSP